ncbi:MAG: alpha/beta hydrolase, partial [Phyllobacterium sp.]|uniref:alpha/beta hydrolase n=1 Tax=Phyllobacterium sp. TaxID=1871046 RepID=UPI0030F14701
MLALAIAAGRGWQEHGKGPALAAMLIYNVLAAVYLALARNRRPPCRQTVVASGSDPCCFWPPLYSWLAFAIRVILLSRQLGGTPVSNSNDRRDRMTSFLECRWMRWLLIAAVVTLTPGCAGRPKNVLSPVAETSPSSSRVDMLVATTRSRSSNPGEMFTGERGVTPAFADITVSIPPKSVRKEGDVAWPKRLPSNPATDFATLKADQITLDADKNWLSASVRKSPDLSVLVFIHGFNNRFEDSVYRFAQIVQDSGVHSAPVLVTWPSRGSLLAYGYDR